MRLKSLLLLSALLVFTTTACKSKPKQPEVTAQPVQAENDMPAPNNEAKTDNFDLPQIPPAKLFQHVIPEEFKLDNGITVWYVHNPMIPLMSFKVVFDQGASADPANHGGYGK